jgi:pyrimidine deaminase RibD-like protein
MSPPFSDFDRIAMAAALDAARQSLGQTAPNPAAVGCVIAQGDVIIGAGRTRAGGRPHAEADALAHIRSGEAVGSTVYVTLEPCAHVSPRGPACADLLVDAKPARVVIAMRDPDPRTSGKGAARLAAAGVKVDIGLMQAEAARSLISFLTWLEAGRPWVGIDPDPSRYDAAIDVPAHADRALVLERLGIARAAGLTRLWLDPTHPMAEAMLGWGLAALAKRGEPV